jgi:hypothetical protein
MPLTEENVANIVSLYQYFDDLVMQEADDDTLFASSYIRAFIGLLVTEALEKQALTCELAEKIAEALLNAKSELTPQDRVIVNNYWLTLAPYFTK